MDEYYCPNCGAILNDQTGFDPNKGTWTCTECGQRLMDDDIYEGDKFQGVAWYCDNCGALLNKQYGFSDSTGTWICTECGHTNGTTKEDILDDDEIIECPNCRGALNIQLGFSEYVNDWECAYCGTKLHRNYSSDDFEIIDEKLVCPNCNAYLPSQSGFSEYDNDWTCDECSTKLHRNYSSDDFEIIDEKLVCPNCNAYLPGQSGFSEYDNDWTCDECSTKLHRNYSCDDFEIIDEKLVCPNCNAYLPSQSGFSEYDNDWTCDECGTRLHRDYSWDLFEVVDQSKEYDMDEEDENEQIDNEGNDNNDNYDETGKPGEATETQKQQTHYHQTINIRPKNELRKDRFKAFIFHHKKIRIGFDCADLLRKNISEVKIKLLNRAFNNIKAIPVYDIYVDSEYTEGEVEQIVICGNSFFETSDYIPYDAEIIITYHLKKRISIPFSQHLLLKKNYVYVSNLFQGLGFTEIYEKPIKDLITGWITKDGSVENIYIANSDSFKKNSSYEYDVKIIIEYHTFKRK